MTGLVLAGGRSSRMGQDKALLPFDGRPLVQRVALSVARACRPVWIVGGGAAAAGEGHPYRNLGFPLIRDRLKGRGPVAGLHAGLLASESLWNFVCACDLPFISPRVIEVLKRYAVGTTYEAVVACSSGGRWEPLAACYSRLALKAAEERLGRSDASLSDVLRAVRVRTVHRQELERVDPDGRAFFNLNTSADYQQALALAVGERAT